MLESHGSIPLRFYISLRENRHHLAFYEAEQIGFGGYTFQMHGRYHGILIVRIEAGLIKGWREYQYKSGLNWDEFNRQNSF